MTIKAFFKSTGTVSLKVLRALWRAIGALMAGFVWALAVCLKHASAANDDSTSGADMLSRDADSFYDASSSWNYETEDQSH